MAEQEFLLLLKKDEAEGWHLQIFFHVVKEFRILVFLIATNGFS